jgi:hypothetical protein
VVKPFEQRFPVLPRPVCGAGEADALELLAWEGVGIVQRGRVEHQEPHHRRDLAISLDQPPLDGGGGKLTLASDSYEQGAGHGGRH